MDPSCGDVYDIYRRYSDIRSGKAFNYASSWKIDEAQKIKFTRDALIELSKYIDVRVHSRSSVVDELQKLMHRLGNVVDSLEFSQFYDFVFFICRENGQKNISINKAVAAWRLVLAGRFRLLNHWCDFVLEKHRHNISEDTWQQVLAFSRCVQEDLEGYDPEGAWPVLIDDFVEHMYRILGSLKCLNLCCSSGYEDCIMDEPLAGTLNLPPTSLKGGSSGPSLGLNMVRGLKRKSLHFEYEAAEFLDNTMSDAFANLMHTAAKRNKMEVDPSRSPDDCPSNHSCQDCLDSKKHSSPVGSSISPCAVEGCLSRGFACLLSARSCLNL